MRFLLALFISLAARADTLYWSASGPASQWQVDACDDWQPSIASINATLTGQNLAAMMFKAGQFGNTALAFDVWNFVPPVYADCQTWAPFATSSIPWLSVTPPMGRSRLFRVTPLQSITLAWSPSVNASGYVACCWSANGTNYAATGTTNVTFSGLLGGIAYTFDCIATNSISQSIPSTNLPYSPPWISVTNKLIVN